MHASRRRRSTVVTTLGWAVVSTAVLIPVTAQPASAETLAYRYAPAVYLHPSESYYPSSVTRALGHSDLKFARDFVADPTVDATVSPSGLGANVADVPYSWREDGHTYFADQCTRPRGGCSPRASYLDTSEGFYVEMNNDYRAGYPNQSAKPASFFSGPPVYYEFRSLSTGGYALVYWFFYEYNAKSLDRHEGDWEHIVVKLNSNYTPAGVFYASHNGCWHYLRWRSAPRVGGGNHPIVYSALGSHASYPTAGTWDICGAAGYVAKDYAANGKAWYTWGNVVNARARPWYGFGGAWGTVGTTTHTTGPLGPSRYKSILP